MDTGNHVKVWDLFIRMFHWTLVAAFTIAYVTGENLEWLHIWSGYLIVVLLMMRIVWGFIGSEHARFRDFITVPAMAWDYLKKTLQQKAPRYIGHNPAGGWMILIMIMSLLAVCFSGIVLYAIEDQAGPLGTTFFATYHRGEDFVEELHELLANITVLLIFLHISGVMLESMIHQENLVRAMWNGNKERP